MWGLAGGPGTVSYPALSLYGLYGLYDLYGHFRSTTGSTYDVTVGGNDVCGGHSPASCENSWGAHVNDLSAGGQPLGLLACGIDTSGAVVAQRYQCNAEPGYDGVSGVGTPNGVGVFTPMSPVAKLSVGGTVTHGVAHAFSAAGSASPFPGGTVTVKVSRSVTLAP